MTQGVQVRGNATAEELAAILAVVAQPPTPEIGGYAHWRSTRLAALRATNRCPEP